MIPIATSPAIDWPFDLELRSREPLSEHTYLGIGGPAEYYVEISDRRSFAAVLDYCHDREIKALVIGEGSNLLVGDKGVPGLVIHNACRQIHDLGDGSLRVDSGALMGQLAHWCADRGYSGLEFGVGIPGSVGGSVFGNAGCFGTEMSDVLVSADVWASGQVASLDNKSLEFEYRFSKLRDMAGNPIVVGAVLRYQMGDPDTARARITDLSRRRRDTQPASRSAGSVFKNPQGEFAGRLIDRAGLKGRTRGRAAISTRHANFIVNEGGATASEVWALVTDIRAAVRKRFDIDLELEIQLAGEGFGDGG